MRRPFSVLLAAALATTVAATTEPPGPEAAREQYRVARRLAAEGSTGAADALRKVVALDPAGPLADDALVDLAVLLVPVDWPEDLGRLPVAELEESRRLLERAAGIPGADRAAEAGYRLSLLALAPAPGRDGTAARQALLRVASRPNAGNWGARARYAAAWADAALGESTRARGAFTRIVLDAPGSAAAGRASLRLGLLDLREGRPGTAARWLQRAAASESAQSLFPGALRRAAVRDLDRAAASRGWGAVPARTLLTDARTVSALARTPDGSLLVADRKGGTVRRLDPEGRESGRWTLEEPSALTVDPYGRAFVAAGERVFVLDGSRARAIATLGRFAPASALAADPSGRLYVLDRRGDRIGIVSPGSDAAAPLREERGTRLAGLVWDGRRLVAADARAGRLLEIGPGGAEIPLALSAPFAAAAALAVDPAGRFAVSDSKSGEVLLLDAWGKPLDRIPPRSLGFESPAALAVGPDGSLDLWDEGGGAVWRVP